jgi:hypothetical protein
MQRPPAFTSGFTAISETSERPIHLAHDRLAEARRAAAARSLIASVRRPRRGRWARLAGVLSGTTRPPPGLL